MMVVLVGFGAFVVDVGRIYFAQRQLQNAVDASALSAAQNMPDVYKGFNTVPNFDGVAPSKNALFGYGVTAEGPVVTFQCSPNAPGYDPDTNSCPADASPEDQPATEALSASRAARSHPSPAGVGCNAVTVSETATVKSTLAGIFGFSGFTHHGERDGQRSPAGIGPDPAQRRGHPRHDALDGRAAGRSSLRERGHRHQSATAFPTGSTAPRPACERSSPASSPCNGTCTGNVPNPGNALGANVTDPLDEVGLVTFPALSNVANRPDEIDCTRPQLSRTTTCSTRLRIRRRRSRSPATTSSASRATTGPRTTRRPRSTRAPTSSRACTGASAPGGNYPGGDYYGLKDVGQQSTYLAGALAEAQYQLAHAPPRASGPTPVNVIIVLSDGQLNQVTFANGGHDNNPCASAAAAATAAKGTGTLIYSIAYDSTQNCTDNSGTYHNVRGLTLMQNIATPNTQTQTYFYNQPAYGDLTDIFTQISQALAQINTRLIANP